METRAARSNAMCLDLTMSVWADTTRTRTLAEVSQVTPVEPWVTHLAFKDATKRKKINSILLGLLFYPGLLHPQWEEQAAFLSLLIQTFISPRNTLTDTPRIKV